MDQPRITPQRQALDDLLRELLGSTNVYYQPPKGFTMSYPCIRYSRPGYYTDNADNITYRKNPRFELIVMDYKPDNPVIEKLLEQPMCSFVRHYESDGLNHDVLEIYI